MRSNIHASSVREDSGRPCGQEGKNLNMTGTQIYKGKNFNSEGERNCKNGESVFWFAKPDEFLPDRGDVTEESEIKQYPKWTETIKTKINFRSRRSSRPPRSVVQKNSFTSFP